MNTYADTLTHLAAQHRAAAAAEQRFADDHAASATHWRLLGTEPRYARRAAEYQAAAESRLVDVVRHLCAAERYERDLAAL